MTTLRTMLTAVGVSEEEEAVYRALLGAPSASLQQLSQAVGRGRRGVKDTLDRLEKNGLVSRAPGRAARFVPAPPEVGVEALAHRRLEEIERVRLEAARMGEELRQSLQRARPAEVIEVVVGRGP